MSRPVVTLPANTLLFRNDGPKVAIARADNRMELRSVTLGRDLGPEGVVMVNLSLWQLRRLDERKDANRAIRANATLAPAPVDEVLAKARNSGRFDDITLQKEPGRSGYIIRFNLTERRIVRSIKYDGNKQK